MSNLDNLMAQVSSSSKMGRFEAMLDAEVRAELDGFVDWLVASGKTSATSRSYKSYVAKAVALGQDWDELSSDQKSAVRAFAKFRG